MDNKQPLKRTSADKWLGGVIGGLSRHFNIDISLLRLIAVVSFFATGFLLFFVYLLAWVIMPSDSAESVDSSCAVGCLKLGFIVAVAFAFFSLVIPGLMLLFAAYVAAFDVLGLPDISFTEMIIYAVLGIFGLVFVVALPVVYLFSIATGKDNGFISRNKYPLLLVWLAVVVFFCSQYEAFVAFFNSLNIGYSINTINFEV